MSSNRIILPRGTLLGALHERTRSALALGALAPIDVSTQILPDAGVAFVVRKASALKRKEAARSRSESADPFLPYDPALLVAEVSDTHVALLNKFAVLDGHLLIVTRHYEDQERLITRDDWVAFAACLREVDAFGFYNGSSGAGASQAHKHLQLVPLASLSAGGRLPVETLFGSLRGARGLLTVKGLPFHHLFTWLDREAWEDIEGSALEATYRGLLAEAGLRTVAGPDGERQSHPYNLVLTREWMILVPRSAESFQGISVNGLGFAGSLFVPDADALESVRRVGPMKLLAGVALPARSTNPLARNAGLD